MPVTDSKVIYSLPAVLQARWDLQAANPCIRHQARQVMLREYLRLLQWAASVRAVLDSMEPVH